LRQGEDENQDRPRAGPQPDGNDRREPAPPATRPGQLLRFRSVRVAPWQCAVFFAMFVRVRMAVIMSVPSMLMRVFVAVGVSLM
jgi:hypothetical protein